MVNSMTGFGRSSAVLNGREITVEVRSVNHRYLEMSVRSPRMCSYMEDKIKARVQSRISRGKTDVGITINTADGGDVRIELNMNAARSYAEAIAKISAELGVNGDVSAATIARFPDVFTVEREIPDEEQLWADVCSVLDGALESYCEMRAAEGERLRADLLDKLANIEKDVEIVEKQSADRLARFREKLFSRMKAVLEDTQIDENRILLEAAIYADKAAVDEETVRLRSHIGQFRDILAQNEPVGRKLDFLIQEINRETNTIGSKANDLDITAVVVDLKSEIEKIREQVQNIE